MAVPIPDENERQDQQPRQEIDQHDHAGQCEEDGAQEEVQHPPAVASRNIIAAAWAFTAIAAARIMRNCLILLLVIGGWIVCHPEDDARCEWPLVAVVVAHTIGRWTIRPLNERRRHDEPLAAGAGGRTIHGRMISHPEGDTRHIETHDTGAIGYSDGGRIICQPDDDTIHQMPFASSFEHTSGGRIIRHPNDDIQHQLLSVASIPLGREALPPDPIYRRNQRYQNPVRPPHAENDDEEDASSVHEEDEILLHPQVLLGKTFD